MPYKYPGGSYKTSNIQNFPGMSYTLTLTLLRARWVSTLTNTSPSTGSPDMAASLVQLLPGGLRSIHWHDTAEWAYVLNGTCRYEAESSLSSPVIFEDMQSCEQHRARAQLTP